MRNGSHRSVGDVLRAGLRGGATATGAVVCIVASACLLLPLALSGIATALPPRVRGGRRQPAATPNR